MGAFDTSVKQISKILGLTAAGQAAMAASLPVVVASNQTDLPVKIQPNFTYAYYMGDSTGTIAGTRSDILFQRADTATWPLSVVVGSGEVLEYFDTDHANFDGAAIWVYIPMLESGYSKCAVNIRNYMGVSAGVTAYLVAANAQFAGAGFGPVTSSAQHMIGPAASSPYTLATAGRFEIAVGTSTDDVDAGRIVSDWAGGALVIKFDPASDPPGSGYWLLSIQRSR